MESFKISLAFLRKCFCIHRANLAFMSLVPIFNHSEDAMQAAYFLFLNIKVTVSVSCITEERLQIRSLMEQRITNHTFTAGFGAVLLDILRKFIVFRSIYKFFFKGYH